MFLYSFLNGRRSAIFQFDEILDPVVYVFRNWTCDFFIWHTYLFHEEKKITWRWNVEFLFVVMHCRLRVWELRITDHCPLGLCWKSSECVNKNETVVFRQLFIQFKLNKKIFLLHSFDEHEITIHHWASRLIYQCQAKHEVVKNYFWKKLNHLIFLSTG